MNHLWNLIRKELRELLTPATIASVLAVVVMLCVLGNFLGGQVEKSSESQPVILVNCSDSVGFDYAGIAIDKLNILPDHEKIFIEYTPTAAFGTDAFLDEIKKVMNDKQINSTVVVGKDYNKSVNDLKRGEFYIYWNQTSTSVFSSLDTVTATNFIVLFDKNVADEVLANRGATPEVRTYASASPLYSGSTFLKGTLHQNVSPSEIYSAVSQQTMFVPVIIMIIIIMIGSILISSMGSEKENKTLETLLTLPVNRTTIVTGKLMGAAIAGIIMGGCYMVGMYFYIGGAMKATPSGTVSMSSLGLALGPAEWALVVLSVFLGILSALGMCMILGAFAKNYKAAQMYISPIAILAVVPMFITMFSNVSDLPMVIQALLFIIPFTHPMTSMQNLMFGNMGMVLAGIGYLAVFAAAMIFITVRLYKSDILLTGLLRKKKKEEKTV